MDYPKMSVNKSGVASSFYQIYIHYKGQQRMLTDREDGRIGIAVV